MPASVLVHASAEMEHPIAVAAHISVSISDPETAIEAPISGFF
jgi:hypothetical protein